MFLVRVCLGSFTKATTCTKWTRPPCTENCTGSCKHPRYDSVIGDISDKKAREFIVYDNSQCYPEYLVTYKGYGRPRERPDYPTADRQSDRFLAGVDYSRINFKAK